MKTTMSLAAAMGTLALATSAQAAVIQPIDARESTAFSASRVATEATNGNGLDDPTSVETGDPVPVTWTLHSNGGDDQWMSANVGSAVSDQWVMFDLGAAYQTDSMFFWNTFLAATSRGISDMDVSFATSLDMPFATALITDSNWGSTVNLTPAEGVVVDSKGAGELLTYTSVSARYVLFEVTANHGDGSYVGMSEVRFISAVPEPTTTALLGLGGLALILRRRK
jgi:hypothetical protein